MECPQCHHENPQDVKFCVHCGNKLETICGRCGSSNSPAFKFCGECGYDLSKSFETVTLKENEHDTLSSDSPIKEKTPAIIPAEGERKHVTVLFSDITGYTAMSEKLDPEEVKEITGRIFGEISKIVANYDGFIEKYAGDAVMALFGANQSHEDDPVRAVRTALETHRFVEYISPQYEDKIGQPLQMHTGINTGLVVTGELNLEKGIHGAAGNTINVAARMSSAAKSGEILVDHATYSRTEGFFHFEDLEPIYLKGKSEAVKVHRYLAVKDQPQKIHRLHGLRAELIGRKAEIARLFEAIDNLRKGKSAVFSIIGAAGTGKSRLVEDFKSSQNLKEIHWWDGNAFPYAQNIPYFPLIDLISKAIHISEGDSPETVKNNIESSLEVLIGEKQDIAPYIGSLYALEYPEIKEASPQYWKAKLQKAILTVLTVLAQRAPTVICLEDLHWADPSTIELVHFLLSEIRHPVLFICVYRPTISPFSTHQIKAMAIPHHELHLRDLSLSEAQSMVESLLKTDSIPNKIQQFIQNKVEGNPFYLEEAVNSLIESKLLVPENGNWKVVGPITESEISSTVQGVISARVDRLERESKRILQEASVIGRTFYYEILRRISEIKDNIDMSLSGLERFDLIKTKSIKPYLEYIFKHALTQEVVYRGLLKSERREIHERIGHVIEEIFKDRLPEFYETLAYHFKKGQSVMKSVDYLIRSGEKSLKRYAVEESHQHFLEAFEALKGRLSNSYEENDLLINVLIKWAYVFLYRGDFKGLKILFSQYEKTASAINDKAKIGIYYAWFGYALYNSGDILYAYKVLEKALHIGEEIQNEKVIAFACSLLGWTCKELGYLKDAISYGEKAQKISKDPEMDQFLYSTSLAAIGHTYIYMADTKKVFEISNTLIAYGQSNNDVRSEWWGYWLMGFCYLVKGDSKAATDCANNAIQLSVEPIFTNMAKYLLARIFVLDNQFEKAANGLKEIVAYCKEHEYGDLGIPSSLLLGTVLTAQGHLSKGFKMIKKVKLHCAKNKRRTIDALSEYIMGKIYLQMVQRAGPKRLSSVAKNLGFLIKNLPLAGKKSEEHFNNALQASKDIGARGYIAMISLDLSLLHKVNKENDKARECIAEAIRIMEQAEAEGYLKQANEILASLSSG